MNITRETARRLRAIQHEETVEALADKVAPFHAIKACRACDQARRDGIGVNPNHETETHHG